MKLNELKNIDEENEKVKAAKYENRIEELNRELTNLNKRRTEFQNKLENIHNSFDAKLKLYVTDITLNN